MSQGSREPLPPPSTPPLASQAPYNVDVQESPITVAADSGCPGAWAQMLNMYADWEPWRQFPKMKGVLEKAVAEQKTRDAVRARPRPPPPRVLCAASSRVGFSQLLWPAPCAGVAGVVLSAKS